MSTGDTNSPRCWRNHSRTRRLKRFRLTDGPALRPTVIPSRLVTGGVRGVRGVVPRRFLRGVVGRVAVVTTTSSGSDRLRPVRSTRSKSLPSRSRSEGLKPPVVAVRSPDRPADTPSSRLLGRDRDGDPLATLGAPSTEDGASALRLHSLAEPVRSKTLDPTRLKCPLHACGSSLSIDRVSRPGAERAVARPGLGPSVYWRVDPARRDHAVDSSTHPWEARELTRPVLEVSMHHQPVPNPSPAAAGAAPSPALACYSGDRNSDSVVPRWRACRIAVGSTSARQIDNPFANGDMPVFCPLDCHSLLLLSIFNPPSRRAGR